MFVGILFTVIVSISIGTFSTLAFFEARRIGSRFLEAHVFSFGLFWLLMSFVWYLTAVSDFFRYLALHSISIAATYTLQIFVGASLVVIVHFLNEIIFHGWRRNFFIGVYVLLYAVFLATLFIYPIRPKSENFFASQITSSLPTLIMFTVMFFPLWFFALRLFMQTFVRRHILDQSLYRFYICASLSLVMLGAAGSLDETGVIAGWVITASRLISLIAAILAYVGISALHESDELVI